MNRRWQLLAALAVLLAPCDWVGATPSVRAVYGSALRQADGSIDVARTIAALRAAHANAIVLETAHDKQWQDILDFLPPADAAGIAVYLLLPDARHGVGPCGRGPEWWWRQPRPYCKDYLKWAQELARLALAHPSLRGALIDDFESGAFSPNAGFTVDYIRQVMTAKNAIDADFHLLPGIYIPRGLCDFRFTQRGGSARHNARITLTAEYRAPERPKHAMLQLITHAHASDYYLQRLSVNDRVLFADVLRGRPTLARFDLRVIDPQQWRLRFEIVHTGYVNYLSDFVAPWLLMEGKRVPLTWKVESDDERLVCERYSGGLMKPYYQLMDGVVFWSNAFDLLKPETDVFTAIMTAARETVGAGKEVFGHFYAAEPWREPVFASDFYFDSLVAAMGNEVDGVAPWWPLALPYYVGYSSGIYRSPPCDRKGWDYRFRYPGDASYALGFYQGLRGRVQTPPECGQASIQFRVLDNLSGEYAGRWVKELVCLSGRYRHHVIDRKEFNTSPQPWFEEVGTVWADPVAGDEGEQELNLDLRRHLQPGGVASLELRLRADMFRGAGSSPPEVNVYVTTPEVVIDGRPVAVDWQFVSGNALEPLWLRGSEKTRELFATWERAKTAGSPS